MTKPDDIIKAMEGVKWVINCAEVSEHNDSSEYDRVNVGGVRELIEAAFHHSVPYLIHMSSSEVCCGDNANYYGAENTVMVPKRHLRSHYARSKYQAELLVGKADGRSLGDGIHRLRAIILRPTMLYGELDERFVVRAMKTAQTFRGVLPRISNVFTRVQPCYVGNAAWACIQAKQRIGRDSSLGGEEFFITDDTQIADAFEFCQPFLKKRGMRVSQVAIPLWVLTIFVLLLRLILDPIRSVYHLRVPHAYRLSTIRLWCTTHFFNRTKATLRLDYEPLYDPNECNRLAVEYYSKCKI